MTRRRTHWLVRYWFIGSGGLILWLGFIALYKSMQVQGKDTLPEFTWQFVSLSFVLATLVYAIPEKNVPKFYRKNFRKIGFDFILSAFFLLTSNALNFTASATQGLPAILLQWMNVGCFLVGTIALSFGLSKMANASLEAT